MIGNIHTYLPSSAVGTLGLCAIILLLWYITTAFATWYRLRHIPGPFTASFSYFWSVRNILLGIQAPKHEELHKKYGVSIVRTGPNYLVTDDPEILRRFNGARSHYPRHEWYSATWTEETGNMGSIIDTALHDKIKAKLAHGYSGRDNINVEAAVDSVVVKFAEVIRDRHISTPKQPKFVDLGQIVRYFTLDVITRLAYGSAFGFLEAEGDLYNYTKSVDRFLLLLSLAMDLPSLRWILNSSLLKGLVPKPTDKDGFGKVVGAAQDIINNRFDHEKFDDPDMVGAFMRHGATRPEAVAESLLTILAGSDTTATAIRTTLTYIIATPRVYSRLKHEILDAVGRDIVSAPITVKQAKPLPYLQAVIHEGFRMRPPAIYGHYKVVPPGGDTLGGVFIPGGTAIGHNYMAMMRSEKIFGMDVDVFRPERFLECSEEKKDEMERTIDLVFGFGRWLCAGKSVAQIELNKIYFELFRQFDFQLVYPFKAVEEHSYVIFAQTNMWVIITPVY